MCDVTKMPVEIQHNSYFSTKAIALFGKLCYNLYKYIGILVKVAAKTLITVPY